MFEAAGIITEWMDYHGYQEYPQQYCGFERTVTVLDLIFNVGPDAQQYFKGSSEAQTPNLPHRLVHASLDFSE